MSSRYVDPPTTELKDGCTMANLFGNAFDDGKLNE